MTDLQKDLVDIVRRFAERDLKPYFAEFDERGEFPEEISQKAMIIGLHDMHLPQKFGGVGLDAKTTLLLLAELAIVDAGFAGAFGVTNMVTKCMLALGNEEQIRRYAQILLMGSHACFCLTEPQSGSDAANLRTSATRDGDNYILDGRKCFISNGGVGKVFIVMAATDRSKGAKGITAFLVERDRPGVSVGRDENKLGIRLSNTTDVIFDKVIVPESNRLGQEGMGFLMAMKVLDSSRIDNAAIALSIARRAMQEAIQYARARICFGKTIANMQGIQFMIAEMAMGIEAGTQLIEHALAAQASGESFTQEAAMAKCFCTDHAMKVTTDAVQIFGGYGYMKDYPVEKLMRDAKIFQIVEGTNQIQRLIIAKGLLKN